MFGELIMTLDQKETQELHEWLEINKNDANIQLLISGLERMRDKAMRIDEIVSKNNNIKG